jgi:hypothetical protein
MLIKLKTFSSPSPLWKSPKKSTAAAPHPSQDKAAADFFSPAPAGESWKF